jgi:DNA-directed RNA polymerase subunit RPC12/RpoP
MPTDRHGIPVIYGTKAKGKVYYAFSKLDLPRDIKRGDPLDRAIRISGTNSSSKLLVNAKGELQVAGAFRFSVIKAATDIFMQAEISGFRFDTSKAGAGFRMEGRNTDFFNTADRLAQYGCQSGASTGMAVRDAEERWLAHKEGLNHYSYGSKSRVMQPKGRLGAQRKLIGYALYNLPDRSSVQELYDFDYALHKWRLVLANVDKVSGSAVNSDNGVQVDYGDWFMSYAKTSDDGEPCAFFEGLIKQKKYPIINKAGYPRWGGDNVIEGVIGKVSFREIDPTRKYPKAVVACLQFHGGRVLRCPSCGEPVLYKSAVRLCSNSVRKQQYRCSSCGRQFMPDADPKLSAAIMDGYNRRRVMQPQQA